MADKVAGNEPTAENASPPAPAAVVKTPLPERDSGDIYIITTPDGADLPATALERDFPLLVRLHEEFFDFSRADGDGGNVRFTSSDGAVLRHDIEEWDPAGGTAAIWVRLPIIRGNARQKITLHWGKDDAASASDGGAVFDESNGYLSVWHMSDPVKDDVGTLKSMDKGTTPAEGMIGPARHFVRGKGIFCGEDIMTFPTGCQPHSSEAWFRGEKQNCRILSWGKEHGQGKVQMWYKSPSHIRMDCYFSDADVSGNPTIPLGKWTHVIHTYQKGESRIYIDGALDKEAKTRATTLSIQRPARMWIGGWYGNYDFVGDIDEVRISKVARSPDWVRLQFENQRPLQTLVGPLVQQGSDFSRAPTPAATIQRTLRRLPLLASAPGMGLAVSSVILPLGWWSLR